MGSPVNVGTVGAPELFAGYVTLSTIYIYEPPGESPAPLQFSLDTHYAREL